MTDIGSGMFTTGLLGVAWQYIDGNDSEARDTARLKRVLADSAPAMRDAVINGFAFDPDDLTRVATDDVLDQIATNSLAIRLGDPGFAREVYEGIKQQAVAAPERLHDARISIRLVPLPAGRGRAHGRTPLFLATIRSESSLHPKYQTRRFSCIRPRGVPRDQARERRQLRLVCQPAQRPGCQRPRNVRAAQPHRRRAAAPYPSL